MRKAALNTLHRSVRNICKYSLLAHANQLGNDS